MQLDIDPRAAALLDPVRAMVESGAASLPDGRLEVAVGPVEGWSVRDGGRVVLSEGFEGPGVRHPLEVYGAALPPIDRWRRAAIVVLEEAALTAISGSTGLPVPERPDWRWMGLASEMVDVVAPQLQCTLEGLVLAIETGFPGAFPRAGVAVMKAMRAFDQDPWQLGCQMIEGGVVSTAEWLRIGQWVMDPSGAAALIPVPVARVGYIDIPCAIDAWRWQPLGIPAHPRGGRIDVTGPGEVDHPWAPGGQSHTALAVSTEDVVELRPHCGGPVGTWIVTSAEGFGQVMGARGVTFRFSASGRLEITFADAFVGPLAAVKMADEVGTSGIARGRWAVADPYRMKFQKIDDTGLTMHGRQQNTYRMPARGFGISQWLRALEEGPWAWQEGQGRLVMRGQMMGTWIDVRMRAE